MKILLRNLFVLQLVGFCSSVMALTGIKQQNNIPVKQFIITKYCQVEKGTYQPGSVVRLSFAITNPRIKKVRIRSIAVIVVGLDHGDTLIHKKEIAFDVVLGAKSGYAITRLSIGTIPKQTNTGPYGVYTEYTQLDGLKINTYQTFFRVVKDSILTTFNIQHDQYKGLTIFALDGGMSAEYAIEKSGESLAAGMSHSWKVNGRGSGPNQVFSTPQFLENSVKETVSFYDTNFGSTARFENVIISTGIPSVPYLARATKAPVLPLHFLVSSNTVKEIQTILDYSNKRGYSCYSTLGYDSSVPNEAVAWVKLLDLPKEYIDFLRRHHVSHVIILGATSLVGGEATAKKLKSSNLKNKYAPGSLFLLYPQGGVAADVKELKARAMDYDQSLLQNDFTRVADWESGIIPEQLRNFTAKIKHSTTIRNIMFITGKDDDDLYKLATYATLSFIHKNSSSFIFHGQSPVCGVILNPYLISNPVFESRFGYIPLVYWQGNPAKSIIDELRTTIRDAISVYFPRLKFHDFNIWINSSLNFGGAERALALQTALIESGINHIKNNDYSADEIWNPTDGIDAPCELKTQQLLRITSVMQLKSWNVSLKSLTSNDLLKISQSFPSILITKL